MVRVEAPARLHLGFLDLDGGLGRRFGSLGLAIEGFATRLTLAHAGATAVTGADADEVARAERLLHRLGAAWRLPPAEVAIEAAIPAHAGLGSGTQLGLALGVGTARLAGTTADLYEIARLLERGARSGIGIGAFAGGGFILDGGSSQEDAAPPPVTARLPFPPAWRVLLILDRRARGLHGAAERRAFAELPPFPPELAGRLCRRVVMQLLPGLATADLAAVAEAVGEIQRRVGDHFAPAQGGRFTSRAVAEVLAWLEAQGVRGVGQSSWGPTGFALLADDREAERLRAAAEQRFAAAWPSLRLLVVAGRNRGAAVTVA
jgi:beta-RFAP synthase